MIQYLIIILIILYVIFTIYFKIKNQFWSRQPVFHFHNIFYWFFPPGIIQHSLPILNKFYNTGILFDKYANANETKKNDMFNLIRYHYLQKKNLQYHPTQNAIFPYFENHFLPSFVSLMYKKTPNIDVKNKQIIPMNKLISLMTTRPLECTLDKKNMILYYVDYLCVHTQHRKQGNAPQIIYTHYAKMRYNDKKNIIFLFKREGQMTSIVPLTTYYTYGFHIKYWKYKSPRQGNIQNILISKSTIDLFHHFSKIIKENCRCFIAPCLSNLETLIDNNLIYIFLLLKNDNPIACYVFRNPYTSYKIQDVQKNSIDCIASYCDHKEDNKTVFIEYFYQCVFTMAQTLHTECLIIENISDNNIIIQNIFKKNKPIIKSPTAYYFYNFAYRPFLSPNVFLLN